VALFSLKLDLDNLCLKLEEEDESVRKTYYDEVKERKVHL